MLEKSSQMQMPTQFRDIDAEEMEYDGGTNWKTIGLVVAGVGGAIALGGLVGTAIIKADTIYFVSAMELAARATARSVCLGLVCTGGIVGLAGVGMAAIGGGPHYTED